MLVEEVLQYLAEALILAKLTVSSPLSGWVKKLSLRHVNSPHLATNAFELTFYELDDRGFDISNRPAMSQIAMPAWPLGCLRRLSREMRR